MSDYREIRTFLRRLAEVEQRLHQVEVQSGGVEGGAPSPSTPFATPALVLGSAAAAGAAVSVIRSDATIQAFDTTAPVVQAFGDAAAAGAVAKAARRDHRHGMPAAPAAAFKIPYQVGAYHFPGSLGTQHATPPANESDAAMLVVTSTITIDTLAISLTGNATSTRVFRAGIYANKSATEFYPGALLLDAGEIGPFTTASLALRTWSVNIQLTPGVYWTILKNTGGGGNPSWTCQGGATANQNIAPLGNIIDAATADWRSTSAPLLFFRRTGLSAGALSDPFPAAVPLANRNPGPSIVGLKVASIDA